MKTIAIAAGGDSSEFGISVKSAVEVSKALSPRYITYIVMIRGMNWYWEDPKGRFHNIDKNDFSLKTDDGKIRFDAVFIAIHGTPGENGILQGYFDMIGIPYSSCNVFTSSLTFNKQACKLYIKEYGIDMAKAILLRKGERADIKDITDYIGLPCFVKPNASGSSFGVTKVKKEDEIPAAIETALKESDDVLIEAFMKGREVACGVVKVKGKSLILPVTEIISKNEFFDYEAKYIPGKSEEVTPADMPAELTNRIQELSSRVYDLLGCKGIVRVDFIVVDNIPYFLEVNTIPGMTAESLVPQQVAYAGISPGEFYAMVIEDLLLPAPDSISR
jgi:D-alanine-D-alanine ligase